MNQAEGYKKWFIPDGWIPDGGEGEMQSHESLMILNTGDADAQITLDIFFEDRDPVRDLPLQVPGGRIMAFRLDDESDIGYAVPRKTQYALRVVSSEKVIVQFGRMDVRQPNLAYYGVMAQPLITD